MTFNDRLNDYIDGHPRECLMILAMILGFIWQSIPTLLAFTIYMIYLKVIKAPRWSLIAVGIFAGLIAILFHLSIVKGFHLNKAFWGLLIENKVVEAGYFILTDNVAYVLCFPIIMAGILSLIDLIKGNPHEKPMKELQEGTHPNARVDIDEVAISKALHRLSDSDHDGTLLGVSMNNAQPLVIPDHYVNQVALVLGTTGAGKTITLRRFYKRALIKGYPLLIVDGKPDDNNIAWLKSLAIEQGRPFFGFNCDENRHYDPLANGGFTELKDKIVCLKDEWSSDYYRSIAEAYLQTTFRVLLKTSTHLNLHQVMDCLVYKKLVSLTHITKDESLMKRVQQLKNYEMKDISGLQAHLDILINSELGYFFEHNQSSFGLSDVINQKGIVYFALPALRFPSFSKVLGKLVINDIKAVIERHKANEHPLFVVFDEFSVFAGEQVLNLVNMGRGKGVHAIFGTQGLADLDRVDDCFKSQVLNCVNTMICHRLNDQESAEAVANWIGTRDAFTVTAQLNTSQGTTGMGTVRRNREFIVHPDQIKQELKVGEAFFVNKVNGFEWEKVRVLA